MKYKIIFCGLMAALISGCSSAYKASQTPDDVYYSPGKSVKASRQIANEDRYEDYGASQEDRYLRMKVRNPDRWSMIDDYSYWNDSRYMPSYSYGYYMNNWNSFNTWNSPYSLNGFSSPYYYGSGLSLGFGSYGGGYYPPGGYGYGSYSPYANVYISKYPTRLSSNVNRPSLNGYSNSNYNNSNNNNYRQGLGNSIRRIFTPNENSTYSNRNIINNNNTNNTYKAPERSYTPSSSGSSSSGGSVSRPARH